MTDKRDYPTGTLNPRGRKSAALKYVQNIEAELDFWRTKAIELGADPMAYCFMTYSKTLKENNDD